MPRSPTTWSLLAVLVAVVAGCAHQESVTTDSQPATPPPANLPRALRSPTDMMIALEDVRGLYLPKRPPLAAVDDAAFVDACERNERALAWHAEDETEWRASGAAAAADVAIHGFCAASIAFYERSGDRVVIKRDRFALLKGDKQVELVARELVHAIQAHALPPPPAHMTSDARRAHDALVQGDAMVTALAFVLSLDGRKLERAIPRLWTDISVRETRSLRDIPFFESWLGGRFVLALYERGGFAAVNDAFAHPPTSSAEIIHPNRYLEHDQHPMDVSSRLPFPEPFAAGATIVHGEVGIRFVLAPCVTPAVATEVAAEWNGDEFTVAKSRPPAPSMLRWVTAWRSEEAAKRFAEVVGTRYECLLRTGVSIAVQDRVVVLVTGPDPIVRQRHARAVLLDVLSFRP